jgi:hypothetical protein
MSSSMIIEKKKTSGVFIWIGMTLLLNHFLLILSDRLQSYRHSSLHRRVMAAGEALHVGEGPFDPKYRNIARDYPQENLELWDV